MHPYSRSETTIPLPGGKPKLDDLVACRAALSEGDEDDLDIRMAWADATQNQGPVFGWMSLQLRK